MVGLGGWRLLSIGVATAALLRVGRADAQEPTSPAPSEQEPQPQQPSQPVPPQPVQETQPAPAATDATPDPAKPPTSLFGRRSSFLFGVSNVFGVMQQRLSGDGERALEFDNVGFIPGLVGTRLALHGTTTSGLTGGVELSAFMSAPRGGGDALGLVYIGPRIGYAGPLKTSSFGYWVRGGPSVFVLASENTGWSTALSAEVSLVYSASEHFGIFLGPSGDLALVGKLEDDDFKYSSLGMHFGLFGEL